jgi:hypothetical protein
MSHFSDGLKSDEEDAGERINPILRLDVTPFGVEKNTILHLGESVEFF